MLFREHRLGRTKNRVSAKTKGKDQEAEIQKGVKKEER